MAYAPRATPPACWLEFRDRGGGRSGHRLPWDFPHDDAAVRVRGNLQKLASTRSRLRQGNEWRGRPAVVASLRRVALPEHRASELAVVAPLPLGASTRQDSVAAVATRRTARACKRGRARQASKPLELRARRRRLRTLCAALRLPVRQFVGWLNAGAFVTVRLAARLCSRSARPLSLSLSFAVR